MLWLFISFAAFARNDLDLDSIKGLQNKLPDQSLKKTDHIPQPRHPYPSVSLETILKSETEYGHVKKGQFLIRLEDNQSVALTADIYSKFFRLEDEQGFKYIQNKDGSCTYKVKSKYFNSIMPELDLYESPRKYTPAPTHIMKADYDKKLFLLPEITLLTGLGRGDYIKELYQDKNAQTGISTQLGVHLATQWNFPLQVGGAIHYERTIYQLKGGRSAHYSSPSLGPQIKSKDFVVFELPFRLQAQYRVGPYAQAKSRGGENDTSFQSHSSDLLISVEHPVKNSQGEFVIGLFFQNQWQNLKNNSEEAKINSPNSTNKSIGISWAQVYQ